MFKKLQSAFAALLLLSCTQQVFAQVPNLGSAANFAVFTSVGAFDNLGTTSITGDAGTNVGAFTGFPPGVVYGAIHNVDAVSAQAALDLELAYTELSELTCGSVLTVTMGSGQTLTPNIYCTGAASTLTGEIILDGQGDPNAQFVIQIDGAFAAATLSSVSLINGANACNVYWQINGAVEIGINSAFKGNIVANGAISLLMTSSLDGRALTRAGAIALNSNLIQMTMSEEYFADADGDGYGDPLSMIASCEPVADFVTNNSDCDDTNNLIHPASVEICNGLDDNCDGLIDTLTGNAPIYPADTAFSCKTFEFVFSTDSCLGCTYQWYKNDNIIVGANAATYATKKPAYYSVKITAPGGCSSISAHTLLHIDYNPNANIYHPNGLNLCAPTPGENILLKVNYLATNTYQWYRNGVPYLGAGADSWRIFPTTTGLYYCTIATNQGCTRNTPVRNVINSCREGLETDNSLLVYPNPANDEIVISYNASGYSGESTIQIISLLGEIVYSKISTGNSGIINEHIPVSALAPGIYTILVLADQETYSTKMIKQ